MASVYEIRIALTLPARATARWQRAALLPVDDGASLDAGPPLRATVGEALAQATARGLAVATRAGRVRIAGRLEEEGWRDLGGDLLACLAQAATLGAGGEGQIARLPELEGAAIELAPGHYRLRPLAPPFALLELPEGEPPARRAAKAPTPATRAGDEPLAVARVEGSVYALAEGAAGRCWLAGKALSRSEDGGATWTPVGKALAGVTRGLVEDAAGRLWIAGMRLPLACSSDGGLRFERVATARAGERNGLLIVGSTLFAVGVRPQPLLLVDLDSREVRSAAAPAGFDAFALVADGDGALVFGGPGLALRVSREGGAEAVAHDLDEDSLAAARDGEGDLWIAGERSLVRKRRAGGIAERVATPGGGRPTAIAVAGDRVVLGHETGLFSARRDPPRWTRAWSEAVPISTVLALSSGDVLAASRRGDIVRV